VRPDKLSGCCPDTSAADRTDTHGPLGPVSGVRLSGRGLSSAIFAGREPANANEPTPAREIDRAELKRELAHVLALMLIADFQRVAEPTDGSPSGFDRGGPVTVRQTDTVVAELQNSQR
jgi:hypothetical protein